jgi:tRNA(Arg) A34 adenosine deaminase TadA
VKHSVWRYRLDAPDSDLYVTGEPCTLDDILRYLRLKYGIERIIYAAAHCKRQSPNIESAMPAGKAGFPKSTE